MQKKFAAALAALAVSFGFSGSAFAYGAIAVDDEVGQKKPGFGWVTGKRSKEEATRAAVQMCRKHGNDSCKAIGWFKNGCGAYASSRKYWGYGHGRTKAIAVKNALEKCGSDRCEVIVAKCES